MAARAVMHQAGAAIVGPPPSGSEVAPDEVPCTCGGRTRRHDTRAKQSTTLLDQGAMNWSITSIGSVGGAGSAGSGTGRARDGLLAGSAANDGVGPPAGQRRRLLRAPRRTDALPGFRQQRFFVGSGVVEAGWRNLIGGRLKASHRFWTARGANAIIAIHC